MKQKLYYVYWLKMLYIIRINNVSKQKYDQISFHGCNFNVTELIS